VAPASVLVAGLDLGTGREREADELVQSMAAALIRIGALDLTAATHGASVDEDRHVAVSIGCTGIATDVLVDAVRSAVEQPPAEWALLVVEHALEPPAFGQPGSELVCLGAERLRPSVTAAVAAHRTRPSGRVVVFPGSELIGAEATVGELVGSTAIDRVQVLAAPDPDEEAVVVTRHFLRPRWVDGQLVLHLQPGVGGTLVPFEVPTPTPCCAAHA
jgi:hypothetical protein